MVQDDQLEGPPLHLATRVFALCWAVPAGWQVVQDDLLKMMYQHQAGTTVHSFKGRCILDSPVEVRTPILRPTSPTLPAATVATHPGLAHAPLFASRLLP